MKDHPDQARYAQQIFRHRLALRLGKTLAELGDVPQAELTEWLAFFAYEAEMAKKEK